MLTLPRKPTKLPLLFFDFQLPRDRRRARGQKNAGPTGIPSSSAELGIQVGILARLEGKVQCRPPPPTPTPPKKKQTNKTNKQQQQQQQQKHPRPARIEPGDLGYLKHQRLNVRVTRTPRPPVFASPSAAGCALNLTGTVSSLLRRTCILFSHLSPDPGV